MLPLLMSPSTARAQPPATSFDALQPLVKPGDTVTVSDAAGGVTKGFIVELTHSVLVLRTGDAERRYGEAQTSRIHQRQGDSLAHGALIGAGVGAASRRALN